MASDANDRIYPITRIVSALIVPFLLLAFLLLFFFPERSGTDFAYRIEPAVMAGYVGAGYLGGALLFLHVLFGKSWHRVAAGFPAVTAFTVSMLLVTLLHWNRYSVGNLPFQIWLVLYLVTPVVVPLLWLLNRRTDLGTEDPDDVEVPQPVRLAVRALGAVLVVMAVVGFLTPTMLIAVWPWQLWPLSARLLSGWGMLLAVSNLYISFEPRWSSWRIGVQSIALWHVLFLYAAVRHPGDFGEHGLLNWYVASVVLILAGMAALYAWMEQRRRQRARPA